MATPTFDCIRQNFPAARIVGLIRSYARGVVEDGPWFDELIEINDKTIGGLLHLISQLRRLKPDLAVILPNSFRSVLIARLGGARRIYGYRRNGRTALMTGGPAPWRNNNHITPMPMVEYYMEICRWLNFDRPSQLKPRLFCSDTTLKKGARIIESYGIRPADMVIGMNPGARFGSSKCWPPEHFARLAEMISRQWDCKIMLFIGPGEQDLGQRIVKLSRAKIINTGPDKINLSLLKPLIQRCRLLITNDTGPRHYAVAFDIPVVVIMGPTDPRYTNANLGKTIVLRRELECAPCHHKECAQHHSCMAEISPQEVKRAVEQLLQEHS
ncbi:MAG: lipopolysaccharide heptosyltransferase II [Deltaproteobacteria bacterium]|nr:lipopolysaccharide heptosyltransferase II [Deltaproteobacteria bacterium]